MITILISTVLMTVLSLITNAFGNRFVNVLLGICIGYVIGFILSFCLEPDVERVSKTYQLENMQDNRNIEGRFFLGCGTINQKMYYAFYYNSGEFIQYMQIPHDEAKIAYTDGTPRLEVITYKTVENSTINLFTIRQNCKKEQILHIPRGSIKQNFNLNAE